MLELVEEEEEPLVLELPVDVDDPLPAEGCRVAELLLLEDELEEELPELVLPADVLVLALVEDVAGLAAGIRYWVAFVTGRAGNGFIAAPLKGGAALLILRSACGVRDFSRLEEELSSDRLVLIPVRLLPEKM